MTSRRPPGALAGRGNAGSCVPSEALIEMILAEPHALSRKDGFDF